MILTFILQVSAISPKQQTTRDRILGIVTEKNTQLVCSFIVIL